MIGQPDVEIRMAELGVACGPMGRLASKGGGQMLKLVSLPTRARPCKHEHERVHK